MLASINSIESFSTVDGPGIRTVIFFNECLLRCKYCHNPEMWNKQISNMSVNDLYEKIKRNINYFGKDGGVTLSGGEPLLHLEFIIELCKLLKKDGINIALDTAGYCLKNCEELLKYIDIVIFDIKDPRETEFKMLTGGNKKYTESFIEQLNFMNKKLIIRQVIVPGYHDNLEFIIKLKKYITKTFKFENIIKIEFLPYHTLGKEKYEKLGLNYPLNISDMDKEKCKELYNFYLDL